MLLIGEDLVTPERSIVMNKLAKVTMPTFVPRGTTSRKSYLPPSGAFELAEWQHWRLKSMANKCSTSASRRHFRNVRKELQQSMTPRLIHVLMASAKTLLSSSTEASYPSVRRSRYSTSRVKKYFGGRSG
ncbi:hypothetical protein NEUTE2DRAFT_51562 [Neurospora tetrasperma FGSC 2509]|nr:hypothetical protein NEUTE2DRAFT_51562 [Neurospora tetrasperma FGSC 2509]